MRACTRMALPWSPTCSLGWAYNQACACGLTAHADTGMCMPWLQALECGKTAKLRRVYYDFADYLRTNPTGNVPYTPSLPLLYGTAESIKMLKEEGWVV